MTWYGVARKCGECDTESNLHELAYSADGEIACSFYCPKCKKDFTWRVFASQLQHDALCRDLSRCHTGKVTPVSAPAVVTPQDFSEEDQKFLKLFNITLPKGKPN